MTPPPADRRPVGDPAVRLLDDDAARDPVEHLVHLCASPEAAARVLRPAEPALAPGLLGGARPVRGVAEEERVDRREQHRGHGRERGPGERPQTAPTAADSCQGSGEEKAAVARSAAAVAPPPRRLVRESRRDAPHDARRGSPRRQQQRREVPVMGEEERERAGEESSG